MAGLPGSRVSVSPASKTGVRPFAGTSMSEATSTDSAHPVEHVHGTSLSASQASTVAMPSSPSFSTRVNVYVPVAFCEVPGYVQLMTLPFTAKSETSVSLYAVRM